MSTYSIALNVKLQPETPERVLRIVRHRGFKILELSMQYDTFGCFYINIKVESERSASFLTNQLSKLIDVIECQEINIPDHHRASANSP